MVPLATVAHLRQLLGYQNKSQAQRLVEGKQGMRDVSGRSRPDFTSSEVLEDDTEVVVLDFTCSHWQLIEHRPNLARRTRGVDPYNSAEPPRRQQPWQRVGRR